MQKEMSAQAERGTTTANRWLASVRACLEEARRQSLIPANPAMGMRQFREAPPRARVLSREEYARAVAVIEAWPDPFIRLAFQLLRDLGPRKSEVLRARWEDMDLDEGLWRIPSPKADTPQFVPLSEDTVAQLRAAPRMGPWVIPGRDPQKPRTDLKRPWEEIRIAAGLDGVTIHDLRRTFGKEVARTAGLHVAQKLLRHSDIRVTEKVYAPLGIDSLREAVEDTQRRRKEEVEEGKGK